MGKTSDLSAFERGMVVSARRGSSSILETSGLLGFSCTTVSRVRREGWTNKHPVSGSPEDQNNLLMRVRRRMAWIVQLTGGPQTGKYRRSKTVVSLSRMGYCSRRPHILPLLSAKNQKKLQWARDHKHWTIEEWKTWPGPTNPGSCGVMPESMAPSYLLSTVRTRGGGVMVWGMFSLHMLGPFTNWAIFQCDSPTKPKPDGI
jgi:hypothetical protein